VPDRSIESVRDVLLEVIADAALRERVGRSAGAWARKHLAHSTLVECTQKLYERLLSEWSGSTQSCGFNSAAEPSIIG